MLQSNSIIEKHYRVNAIAEAWGLGRTTVIGLFQNEPGVLKIVGTKRTVLSVPATVMLSVHERLGNKALQSGVPGSDPLRVVRLGDLHTGMSKKPRNVIKLNAGKKLPYREGIA
jgi:hypothetical protein